VPNKEVQDQIEKAELILADYHTRAADDPHKLTTLLFTTETDRLAALRLAEEATYGTGATRAAASGKIRAGLDELRALHSEGYNFIKGLLRSVISAPDRLGLFTSYGWESGEIGDFDDARIEAMANQAIAVTPTIANPAHRYPAAILDPIAAQLLIVNTNQTLAAGGTQAATEDRDAKLLLLEAINERVRHHFCAASDLRTKNPELAKIGFQVQREAGEAEPPPDSEQPADPVFDPATNSLTVPAKPAHSAFLRAYRQPLGGAAEAAGVSNTTTVSVVQFSPLTPGVTYEFWLVGVNSQGEGPQSNHVTHAVPLEP